MWEECALKVKNVRADNFMNTKNRVNNGKRRG